MKITWIGHSCFKLEKEGYAVVIDPYGDGAVPGYTPVREAADLVLCSHAHGDHNAKETVTLRQTEETPFHITEIHTFHDGEKGVKRGENIIHVIDDGETRLAHLGDLGCPLEPEQAAKLKGLDVLLIPVGGFYTIDAGQAAAIVEELAPRIVIPMHYRSEKDGYGYDVIGTVDEFTELTKDDAMVIPSCELDSMLKLPSRVVVLQAKNRENAGA